MKTNLPNDAKLLYFIIGPPRGGTTVLSSLFNSLDDGFCLGEPHWLLEAAGKDAAWEAYGKVGGLYRPVDDYMLIMHTNIIRILEREWIFKLGGYKETWQHFRHTCEPLVEAHKPLVDFFIVVLRDPIRTLSSQLAHGWNNVRPRDINKDYRRMDTLARHDKGIGICFEDFCDGPLEYLNERLPFDIEGRLILDPTGHRFGDPLANKSIAVDDKQPYRREIILNEKWIKALAPAIGIWQSWKL